MTNRRLFPGLLLVLLAAACGPAEPDTHESPTSSSSTDTAPGSSSDATTTTTTAPTTGVPDPTTTTDEPDTSTTTTTTASTSTGSTTGDSSDETSTTGAEVWLNKPAGLTGCPLAAAGDADVQGTSGLGPFTGTRALFGFHSFSPDVNDAHVRVWIVGATADLAQTVQEIEEQLLAQTGPAAFLDFEGNLGDAQWLGQLPLYGAAIAGGEMDLVDGTLEFTAHAGSWDLADPDDPPRLLGAVTGDLAGPFDAVYCDDLTMLLMEG